jgi:uncharacterized protein YeaO (DUF488 family)
MKSESVIREEPGEYRVTARYSEDGTFSVIGETVKPITLTVRVEDVWNRVPEGLRRYSYRVAIWRDNVEPASNILENVAPDARIFLDFSRSFRMEFK